MNDEVRMIGLNRVLKPESWDDGCKMIAFYDCEVRGFRFHGCLLIKTARGGLTTQLPRGDTGRGNGRANHIVDGQIRDQMCDAAKRLYVTLGGVI